MRWPAEGEPPIVLGGFAVRRAGPGDTSAIQTIFELDPAFFELSEGAPPRPTEAAEMLAECPPELPRERKHVFVVSSGTQLVAVIELLAQFPDDATWYLGLIYLAPAARGRGLGTLLLDALAAHVRASGGATLRLAVVVENPDARRLYDRLGYRPISMPHRPRVSWAGVTIWVHVLERTLRA